MAIQANSKLAYEAGTITVPTDYAGAADDPARVQLLINILSAEAVDTATDLQNRMYLDEIGPVARVYLIAHLTKMKASVT